jgi:hypothetical protein
MVITLYTDRRSNDISDIVGGLARALARLEAEPTVVVVGAAAPREWRDDEGGRVAFLDAILPADVGPYLLDLAARYAMTVVALEGAPNEQMLAVLDASARVLLVSDPSVASLRATQRALKLCASLGYGSEKVAVLLHGFADDAPLAPAEAAAVLKREIVGMIPAPAADPATRALAFRLLAQRLTTTP